MSCRPFWCAALLTFWLPLTAAAAMVTVDFTATSTEPPLSKTLFGVYQTPFWFKRHPPGGDDARRMVALLREAGVRDLRYELAWGKPDVFAPDMVKLDAHGKLAVELAPLNLFLSQLAAARIAPLLALTYCPTPLQHGPPGWQRWKESPSDLAAWSALCHQAAVGWAFCHPAFEVWNEPDLPGDGGKVFFNSDPAAYGRLYAATAAGTGSAPVGGPAIAYDTAYLTASGILHQPINFVTVHAYANAPSQLAAVRAALGTRHLPIRLTEYASYADAALAGSSVHHAAAAAFFADVKELLTEPRLSKVYWAQWVDNSLGMVDEHLHRRALFNALLAYQTLLPTTRRPVHITGAGVDALAAADSPAAAVAVWNATDGERPLTLTMSHLPGGHGTLRLFRIDANHASYGDDPTAERLTADERLTYAGGVARWSGSLPARSVVLLRADEHP